MFILLRVTLTNSNKKNCSQALKKNTVLIVPDAFAYKHRMFDIF